MPIGTLEQWMSPPCILDKHASGQTTSTGDTRASRHRELDGAASARRTRCFVLLCPAEEDSTLAHIPKKKMQTMQTELSLLSIIYRLTGQERTIPMDGPSQFRTRRHCSPRTAAVARSALANRLISQSSCCIAMLVPSKPTRLRPWIPFGHPVAC